MSKSQQMRWSPQSAHLLLQVRIRVIDGRLRQDFERWYPGFTANHGTLQLSACPYQIERSQIERSRRHSQDPNADGLRGCQAYGDRSDRDRRAENRPEA